MEQLISGFPAAYFLGQKRKHMPGFLLLSLQRQYAIPIFQAGSSLERIYLGHPLYVY